MGRVKLKNASEQKVQIIAKGADSDHPAYPQSIIRAFEFHLYILQHTMIPLAESEGLDQTVLSDRVFRCPYMAEDTFSHDVVHLFYCRKENIGWDLKRYID